MGYVAVTRFARIATLVVFLELLAKSAHTEQKEPGNGTVGDADQLPLRTEKRVAKTGLRTVATHGIEQQ